MSVFLLLAVAGLFYVKWYPYYGRAFVAAANHSIGHSILMGDEASAPAPSWSAALGYALAYGKAIWQAMLLGLLLGSGIQALLPVNWVQRVLGSRGFGGVLAGGLLAVPGMMCTCCAAPVVVGLRKHQAAPGAAMAFWLGNTV
ncbi:MAG TPA: permease, partial [Dyella sp.]